MAKIEVPGVAWLKMESQKDAIEKIEKESSRRAEEGRGSFLRLFFIPQAKLLKSLFLRGMIFKGVAGLKFAFNEWALLFVTEAKRYEKTFRDKTRLEQDSKDFK